MRWCDVMLLHDASKPSTASSQASNWFACALTSAEAAARCCAQSWLLYCPGAMRHQLGCAYLTCCQALDLLGEGGAEQHGLALAGGGHVLTLDNAPAGQQAARSAT
jgi:hypothetical protein